jgi:HTH-type transcriptional regulator/antitoxin HigA
MEIKIPKNTTEYEAALERVEELMDLNPSSGTKEYNELEVLTLILVDYENKHYLIAKPSPAEAIKFRMEQMGLSRRDLIPYFGSASRISEFFTGKRNLSLNIIRALNEGLGIPLNVLVDKPESSKRKSRKTLKTRINPKRFGY